MTSESFISEFHDIKGVLVGERKRNIQKLLKNKTITDDDARLIVNNLKPKTYLETLLYIDILIYLRQSVELLEILKNGNEACASKIIKQLWFFKETFSDVSVEELVNDVLPTMSFSVKVKLLKKLLEVFPEEKIDKIFDAVLKRYGLFVATTVVPGCSSKKIENILKNNEVKLWTNQLKKIYNKQPNLISIYLDVHKQEKSENIFDDNFLIYLAQKNPAYFWDLIENHKISNDVKLGRKTTKKLIERKTNEIVNEPKKYIKYFRHETLVRNLNKLGVFKQLYRNLFPKNIEKLEEGKYVLCNELLKYHPKHSRYQLFTETFSEVLHENISSNLSCLDNNFLELMADVEAREALAQLKLKETNDDEYIKYFKTEKCFALIKEKINVTTSIKKRKELLFILVKSCGVNKDLKSLEKLLKYFCERHRNDDASTRSGILDLIDVLFKLDDLNETHWKYLNEIFTIQNLNKEYSGYNFNLQIAYIKYLFQNNRPDDDINRVILEYLVHQVKSFCSDFSSLINLKDSELEKKILLQAVEHVPNIIEKQKAEGDKSFLFPQMFKEIFTYNLRHKENPIIISKNEKLVQILRSIFKFEYAPYSFHKELAYAVCKPNRNDLENEMLTYYWEKSISDCTIYKVIYWYLKYEPWVIVENIERIMDVQSHITSRFWFRIKSYSHLNLDDIVVKYCLNQLEEEDDDYADKSEFIRRISILAAPEYYIKIMENDNLIPTTSKLEMDDEKGNIIYKRQRAFLKNFRNVKDPIKFLPMLVDKFCQGDLLKSSLIALYGAFYNCPEHELKPYLNKLAKNDAVSVKKHALSLACCVFDRQTVLTILHNFEANKNSSLQKCMFLSCLKYFSKNPDKEFFEKVTSLMSFLKEHDEESLKILPTVNIYRNYKHYYILNVLKLLIKFKDNDKDGIRAAEYDTVISSTLDLINKECIQKLPQDFCKEIIQKLFLINQSIPGIYPFVIKYLLYRSERNDNFDFVFKLLSNYKLQVWNDSSMAKERKNIYTFFDTFYNICQTEVTSKLVLQFSSYWEKIFTPIETFEEHILLNLLQFKIDSERQLEAYSKKIVLFSEKLIEEFGQIALLKFVKVLAKSLGSKKKVKINVLSNMLKFKTTRLNCILVIELIILDHDLFYKDKIRPVFREIDSILKEITDPNVQLFYNLYLKMENK